MTKKTQSPWKNLADCVGTAIAAVAVLPLLAIDAIISSTLD